MNINPTFFIIMVELLAIESIILIVISALYIRRKYQCKAVLQNIISATETSGKARQEVLEKTLKDMFKDSEENTSEIAARLVKAESNFHKRLLSTFIEQDHESLSGLFKWTDKLLSPYRTMISNSAAELENVKKQSSKKMDSLKHTVNTLSEEKNEINEQLDNTRQELNSIMSEYVSAFDKEKQMKEQASENQSPGKTSDATSRAYTVEKQDDGVYIPTDEGIMVESDEETTDEISIEGSDNHTDVEEPDTESLNDGFEISIDDSDEEEDEGMLKVEDLEDQATATPEAPTSDTPENSDAPKNDAILDDVDISSLADLDSNDDAPEPEAEAPQKVAAGQP